MDIATNMFHFKYSSFHIKYSHKLSKHCSYSELVCFWNERSPTIIISIIFIIIIKTSSTGSSGENKVVYKFLSQPHKHLRHRKLKKPTVECTLDPIQCSGVKHSAGKVIPHSNPCKLGSFTP